MSDMSLDIYRNTLQTKLKDYEYHEGRTRELILELEELVVKLLRDYPDQADDLVMDVTARTSYTVIY